MSTGVTQPRPGTALPSSRRAPGAGADRDVHAAATGAGVGIVLLAVLATFGVLFAVDGLVTPGDPARTAQDITGSETVFRLGIVSLLLAVVVDVLVAGGLYRVFRRTSSTVSMIAAWFRVAYAAAFLVAVAHLVGALRLLHAPAGPFTTAQHQVRALSDLDAFTDVVAAGLVLFGAHLLLVGYLAYRSGFVPRLLAALVGVAGAGYVFDSLADVLSNGSAPAVATVTFVGELLLGVWLLVRGRRLTDVGTSRWRRAD